MAFASIAPNGWGPVLRPQAGFNLEGAELTIAGTTANAAGESTSMIGRLWWDDQATHTVSSSGGKIYWIPTGTITFANAGTNVRVGIQDLGTTFEDGSFDVHDDLVGGTDTITTGVVNTTVMSSGSKSIAHQAEIAVVIEMTARGGTDAIAIGRIVTDGGTGYPFCANDTGSGPVRVDGAPYVLVESDDGHFGFFIPHGVPVARGVNITTAASTPDEEGLIFQVKFRCKVNGIWLCLDDVDPNEDGVVRLYSDPLTAPDVLASYSFVGAKNGQNGAADGANWVPITETVLEPDTDYCIAIEATGATGFGISEITFAAAGWRATQMLGTTMLGATRTNGAGGSSPVFSTSTTVIPMMGVMLSAIEIGGGSGPGPHGFAFFS